MKRNFRLSLPALLAAALFCAPALGCKLLQDEAKQLNSQITAQVSSLNSLSASVVAMEASCRQEQSTVAATGARSATAESCVALKETAAMNQSLTTLSESCSTRINAVNQQIELLTSNNIFPLEQALSFAAELDDGLPTLQAFCAREVKQTRELRDSARRLLATSKSTIVKYQEDSRQFTLLGQQTGKMRDQSKAALARCDSGWSNSDSKLAGAKPSRAPASAPPVVPSGKSPRNASTISGEIRPDKLKP